MMGYRHIGRVGAEGYAISIASGQGCRVGQLGEGIAAPLVYGDIGTVNMGYRHIGRVGAEGYAISIASGHGCRVGQLGEGIICVDSPGINQDRYET
jgi:hypothetical protein